MSQKKVDLYKQEKAHRKERIAKEKRRQKITRIVLWAILAVFVLWIACSAWLNVRPEPSVQTAFPRKPKRRRRKKPPERNPRMPRLRKKVDSRPMGRQRNIMGHASFYARF